MTMRDSSRETRMSMKELALRLSALQSPEVGDSLRKLMKRYAQYATSADQVRAILDEALGDHTLTAELYELRGQ